MNDKTIEELRTDCCQLQQRIDQLEAGAESLRMARDYHKQCAAAWIPVSERLPEEDQPVLVYCDNDGPDFGVMWQHNSFWMGIDDQFYFSGEMSYEPTHWMPLPAVPAKETDHE